ncbi:phosphoribosylformylglycinamidine synthase [candidate division WOR-1 bacterium RIFOXYC2_FULL_37_10]|uniref:Phosphoribosylformylglycinamidine synthase subunit PurS n=1 Tax=candidate division WOR-1 bacterium RIFOXYB2_FULL_37_13 TaxID=1802579 RepID=A0A1F4SRS6_UNCSA|nr:MAG: phosphoribosylformylglycinamidine synthase [candidate division WOR-1 bacterium RIFOXYA2_FULL_37_7]OGC23129.1 MAG: phosphoribosylformylglycinamidine synthase [candidate division WOR-1 bacterium RIFOXYB2_FULL_37_13]OGC37296.1 MAG: phosphoribosylformylglycinamidine synthase [candidate division WOR-1 bacterium RIFOXYC2_FULL_37_10]
MKVKIYVTHKKGILDPQGKTVETALLSLGYKNISGVKIEKYIELEIDGKSKEEAEKQVKKMCDELLSNPIIEQYRFEVEQ